MTPGGGQYPTAGATALRCGLLHTAPGSPPCRGSLFAPPLAPWGILSSPEPKSLPCHCTIRANSHAPAQQARTLGVILTAFSLKANVKVEGREPTVYQCGRELNGQRFQGVVSAARPPSTWSHVPLGYGWGRELSLSGQFLDAAMCLCSTHATERLALACWAGAVLTVAKVTPLYLGHGRSGATISGASPPCLESASRSADTSSSRRFGERPTEFRVHVPLKVLQRLDQFRQRFLPQ